MLVMKRKKRGISSASSNHFEVVHAEWGIMNSETALEKKRRDKDALGSEKVTVTYL